MSRQNPLQPKSSLLEKNTKNRSGLQMVMIIVAVHVVFLGGLLFSGCSREESQTTTTGDTNPIATLPPMGEVATPPAPASTNTVTVVEPPPAPVPTNEVITTTPPLPTPPEVQIPGTGEPENVEDVVPLVPEPSTGLEVPVATGQSEYVVVKGDNYTAIARKHGVSVTALKEANPAVDPNRIAIGQVLVIPAKAPEPAAPAVPEGATQYEVKAGDNLYTIAKNHKTTVKEIRDANGLKTSNIRPGQKLIIPKPAEAE
ncbi:MAG: hypothetical protein CMO63_04470 [Verrucomicrobiales bacterium]|nr:hypothetical protein [Verrucomicrobiales bacterium]